ncbi:MAG: sialate O-acetylesterase [Bacteroidota bacterium]|nr:sialate O-acetylesterase [Bacteroidota bacterium]
MIVRHFICLVLLCCFVEIASAKIRLPSLISDNMVLQQQTTVIMWGWADPGERINIQAGWLKETIHAITTAKGEWKVSVKTIKAGGPYNIGFSSHDGRIEVKNVLLGEVWLASGQSNMEFFMGKTSNASYTGVINYPEEIAAANFPMIRQIDVPNTAADSVRDNFHGDWKLCSPATADTFSAVAYYFARSLHLATGFPIGIVNATWGGTPAESWTRRDILEKDSSFKIILDRYRAQCEAYPAAMEKFRKELAEWKADSSSKKGAAPREPIGPTSGKSPAKLYNGMIAPLLSFRFRGVIWYQGEGNADRAAQYRRLFPAMIKNWRDDFHQPAMPFYFVQISPHRSQNAEIRDAQLYTMNTVPHTGMVVTTDNGDSLDIHPRNKKLVGERLARWPLHDLYAKNDVIESGPIYQSVQKEGKYMRIRFRYAQGLVAHGATLNEFTIAGADSLFVPAQARIDGNTVLVWSDAIDKPIAVRFAWRNIPQPNLYNAAGLPASPFRTDDFPLTTAGKN